MRTVTVQSGNYRVLIGPGLLSQAGERVAEAVRGRRCAVVTDDRVGALYARRLLASLEAAGIRADVFSFPNGEKNKTLSTFARAVEFFAERELTRGDFALALGGGVVGDLAGFAAAAYMRGIDYIQAPTTLLAAVDSSVGGKTAVDLPMGKNLVGAFHQPKLVLCDTDVVAELPQPLLRDGAAEMIKYGVLRDPQLFSAMADGSWRERLEEAIARCVSIKRDYVDEDEFDNGARQFLNFGHTFGHAVEKSTNFALSHGQCVAIGMVMAFRAAGVPEGELVKTLEKCGLPTASPCGLDELCAAALLDKKRRGGAVTLVLPEKIGRCELKRVPVGELREWFRRGMGETACR
ncbi:MAG TPA: 3-dehydroquinate synthase [Candidatus Pullichristensenella avicola]|nr:3-dehydroquinate synthase [Candidatus Pullichristensenella avicola]